MTTSGVGAKHSSRSSKAWASFLRTVVPRSGTLTGKRAGTAYTTEDLRLTRFLVNQSAVVLENAKAYTALEAAHVELQSALRRVLRVAGSF